MGKAASSHFARTYGAQPGIPQAHCVAVEADVSKGLHQFALVGLPDKAVEESRDRVSSAIKNSGFKSPKHSNLKIVISLAPAHLKKEGALFDLPIALAYLKAAGEISFDTGNSVFVGELGLDGSVRPVHGALSVARAAAALGHQELFVPSDNAEEAALVSSLTVYPVSTLSDIVDHFTQPHKRRISAHRATATPSTNGATPLDEIRGQAPAKRALEIAAAGEHNIAFYGPPGTGKTMLARALTSILPPLSYNDMLEVTTIHSVAGRLSSVVTEPPFRAPHHTASYASIVGGGATVRPGEVTFVHCGVLFLDEFPEFYRDVINVF
jgi:magnesium chelatase family protein